PAMRELKKREATAAGAPPNWSLRRSRRRRLVGNAGGSSIDVDVEHDGHAAEARILLELCAQLHGTIDVAAHVDDGARRHHLGEQVARPTESARDQDGVTAAEQ